MQHLISLQQKVTIPHPKNLELQQNRYCSLETPIMFSANLMETRHKQTFSLNLRTFIRVLSVYTQI